MFLTKKFVNIGVYFLDFQYFNVFSLIFDCNFHFIRVKYVIFDCFLNVYLFIRRHW